MFTEEDSKRQDAAFEALKEEFSRLVEQEEELRKSAGAFANQPVSEADLPPEYAKALEEAKAKAKREGEARATQFKAGTGVQAATEAPRTSHRRQGVIRI